MWCIYNRILLSWKWKKAKSLSRVQLSATPWTVAYQASPSMEFSRQEYWSGLPFPSPQYLPDPGIKPRSPKLQADALASEPPLSWKSERKEWDYYLQHHGRTWSILCLVKYGAGSRSLLQGSNPGLPHCRQILHQLSHKGSPRILEWVAYPFSRGSSRPRNQTRVTSIAGGFFTNWVIMEAL